MGHHAHADMLWFATLLSALGFVGFFLADRLFAPLARERWDQSARCARPIPKCMLVLAVIAVLWFAVSTVAVNNFIRLINVRADQYSLDHARASRMGWPCGWCATGTATGRIPARSRR